MKPFKQASGAIEWLANHCYAHETCALVCERPGYYFAIQYVPGRGFTGVSAGEADRG